MKSSEALALLFRSAHLADRASAQSKDLISLSDMHLRRHHAKPVLRDDEQHLSANLMPS